MRNVEINYGVKNERNYFENAENFAIWASEQKYGVELTTGEAKMILGYIEGHGFAICPDDNGTILCVDMEEPEKNPETLYIEELIERVCHWNYEFLLDDEVTGEWRERVLADAKAISDLQDRVESRAGYCIGTPTVKELIAILSRLPEDYCVTCCGADNYLYLFDKNKAITIDCEDNLC